MDAESSCHAGWVLKQLQELRAEGHLVDVTLCAEGKEIPCHRVVLSACSNYFKAMFGGSHSESKKDKIEIGGVSAEALQELVDFVYTAEMNITTDNVQPLCEAANMLQVEPVKDECRLFLLDHISPDTCLGIWALADKLSCVQLSGGAKSYALKNFEEVFKTEDFLQLPADFLKRYISDNDLHAMEEKRVLEVIMLWARHDLEERQRHLQELLECVCFSHVDQDFLKNIVETDEVFAAVPGIMELIEDHSRDPRPRQSLREDILVLGGCTIDGDDYTEENETMYRLNLHGNCVDIDFWPSYIDSQGMAACVFNNDIIVTGGIYSYDEGYAWRYKPSLNTWTRMGSLMRGRCWHGMAVLQDQVYVVGGLTYGHHHHLTYGNELSDAEVYSEMTKSWTMMAPLQKAVSYFGITTYADKVYVFGGKSGFRMATKAVQCYDPTQNVWTFATPLPKPLQRIKACTLNSKIYLVGGELECVLGYDPQEDCYKEMVDRTAPWDLCSATVCGSDIVIIGGCENLNRDSVSSFAIQYYNAISDTLTNSEVHMEMALHGHNALAISKH